VSTTKKRKLTRDSCAVNRVEVGIDFIKEIERSWIALLDGKDEGKSHQSLLSTRKLLCHVSGATERDLDGDTSVLIDTTLLSLLGLRLVIIVCSSALHDQLGFSLWNQLLEDFREVLRNLFEGALNCLVLLLVQHLNELLNGLKKRKKEEEEEENKFIECWKRKKERKKEFGGYSYSSRIVEVFLSLHQGLLIVSEILILLKGFLVDMAVLLQVLSYLVLGTQELSKWYFHQ
jgi:hypothetical protein